MTRHPPWLVATLAGLAAVVVVSLVVVIVAGHQAGEVVAFVGEVAAAVAAGVLAVRAARGKGEQP